MLLDIILNLFCAAIAIFVIVIGIHMIKEMKRIEQSRWRNCDITLNEDQFREVMEILYLMDKKNKEQNK